MYMLDALYPDLAIRQFSPAVLGQLPVSGKRFRLQFSESLYYSERKLSYNLE